MKNKWIISTIACLLLIALAACSPANPTGEAAQGTIETQSQQLTQLSNTLTIQPGTVEAAPVQSAASTETPYPESTSEGIWLTFTQNTKCRTGLGDMFPKVTLFMEGDQVEAIGRNNNGHYAYVRFTDSTNHYCWVPLQYANINGKISDLPETTPKDTETPTTSPTPAPGIALVFDNVNACKPNYYLRVLVKNTGPLTWQSFTMTIVDNVTGDTFTESADTFDSYSACGFDLTVADLTKKEYSTITNFNHPFDYDPHGNSLTITITVYSKDGQQGESRTSSLTVTPK